MPAVKCSERARQLVPEPEAVNIDPARTDAVAIPAAMPEMAAAAVPDVAVIPLADDKIPARGPIDVGTIDVGTIDASTIYVGTIDVSASDVSASDVATNGAGVNASTGARTLVAMLLRSRRRRGCDSEPKRSQDGKNQGNFLQHVSSSKKRSPARPPR